MGSTRVTHPKLGSVPKFQAEKVVLLRPTTTSYYYVLLRPTTTSYYYVLLLRTTTTSYYYVLLLRPTTTSYYYVLILRPTTTHYYYVLLLRTTPTVPKLKAKEVPLKPSFEDEAARDAQPASAAKLKPDSVDEGTQTKL